MNLRWHQTYDKNGVYSEMTLQQYDATRKFWEDIPFVIERKGCQEGYDDIAAQADAAYNRLTGISNNAG